MISRRFFGGAVVGRCRRCDAESIMLRNNLFGTRRLGVLGFEQY
jgi:hypothetical protein